MSGAKSSRGEFEGTAGVGRPESLRPTFQKLSVTRARLSFKREKAEEKGLKMTSFGGAVAATSLEPQMGTQIFTLSRPKLRRHFNKPLEYTYLRKSAA